MEEEGFWHEASRVLFINVIIFFSKAHYVTKVGYVQKLRSWQTWSLTLRLRDGEGIGFNSFLLLPTLFGHVGIILYSSVFTFILLFDIIHMFKLPSAGSWGLNHSCVFVSATIFPSERHQSEVWVQRGEEVRISIIFLLCFCCTVLCHWHTFLPVLFVSEGSYSSPGRSSWTTWRPRLKWHSVRQWTFTTPTMRWVAER